MARESEVRDGDVVDEIGRYDLKELCDVCGVHAECIVEMVETGIITPQGDMPSSWRFSSLSILKSRTALRLQRDLEINLSGVAVALDLLDQVESLQNQIKSLKQQLEKLQG
jgi:chaperone modulatory protein CbpM